MNIEFALDGKTRDKPVADDYLSALDSVLKATDSRLGARIVSAGQDAKGSGGKRTGSTRHDVDHTGHSHTSDLVLTLDGKDIRPGDDKALYAKFLRNAAPKFPGIGHYDWGVHIGDGSLAMWGPDKTSKSVDPIFAKAISEGRSGTNMPARKKVSDPAILAKLNGSAPGRKKVTDPNVLAKLNGAAPEKVNPEAPEEVVTTEKGPRVIPTPDDQKAPGIVEDVVRSAGSGLRQGAESLVGAIGSANEATGKTVEWIANYMGASPEVANSMGSVARRVNFMPFAASTSDVQKATNSMVGAPYEPTTKAGEYARTIGEFAPNAIAGPGGIARKTAMAVVPAVMSETAGQITKDTAAEPYARLAGGLAGGVLAAGKRPSQIKMAAKEAPTSAELKSQTNALYGAMRDAGIKYDADAFASTVQTMTDDLLKQGLRPSVAKEAFGLVDDLAKEIGKSPDFDDINGLVQMIGQKARDAAASGDGTAAKAFNVVRDHLMRFEEGATLVSRVPIPADQLNRVRGAARDTAKRNIKSRILDEILVDAETYRGGFDAGVRSQIGNLMRSKRGKQLFKGEERKALLDVANGRKTVQQLSKFGLDIRSLSGNATLIPTLGAIGAGAAGGMSAGGALLAAGTVAKELAPRMTTKAFERAGAAIRSGKLQDKTIMNEAKAERLRANVRRLLSAGASMDAAQ